MGRFNIFLPTSQLMRRFNKFHPTSQLMGRFDIIHPTSQLMGRFNIFPPNSQLMGRFNIIHPTSQLMGRLNIFPPPHLSADGFNILHPNSQLMEKTLTPSSFISSISRGDTEQSFVESVLRGVTNDYSAISVTQFIQPAKPQLPSPAIHRRKTTGSRVNPFKISRKHSSPIAALHRSSFLSFMGKYELTPCSVCIGRFKT